MDIEIGLTIALILYLLVIIYGLNKQCKEKRYSYTKHETKVFKTNYNPIILRSLIKFDGYLTQDINGIQDEAKAFHYRNSMINEKLWEWMNYIRENKLVEIKEIQNNWDNPREKEIHLQLYLYKKDE